MSIKQGYITLNHGKKIGVITLDNPKSLNAQNLEMVKQSSQLLQQWATDDDLLAVIIRGEGEKSFCAGGDIRSLYHAYDPAIFPNPTALEFFRHEYGLCQQIGHYAKPIIVWASGIVMGGGMGLATPASHRIVTQSTMMAMPEIGIGLFPDAGASYFLKKMPDKMGLFFGLTGARFNGADALKLGMADFAMASDDYDKLIIALQQADWQENPNHHTVSKILTTLHDERVLGEGWAWEQKQLIDELMTASSLQEFSSLIGLEKYQNNAYLAQAIQNYQAGSPTSAALAWEIFHDKPMTFDEALAMELVVAVRCCHYGEFYEGVRALLIDKDKQPKWRYTLDTLPKSHIKEHFVAW